MGQDVLLLWLTFVNIGRALGEHPGQVRTKLGNAPRDVANRPSGFRSLCRSCHALKPDGWPEGRESHGAPARARLQIAQAVARIARIVPWGRSWATPPLRTGAYGLATIPASLRRPHATPWACDGPGTRGELWRPRGLRRPRWRGSKAFAPSPLPLSRRAGRGRRSSSMGAALSRPRELRAPPPPLAASGRRRCRRLRHPRAPFRRPLVDASAGGCRGPAWLPCSRASLAHSRAPGRERGVRADCRALCRGVARARRAVARSGACLLHQAVMRKGKLAVARCDDRHFLTSSPTVCFLLLCAFSEKGDLRFKRFSGAPLAQGIARGNKCKAVGGSAIVLAYLALHASRRRRLCICLEGRPSASMFPPSNIWDEGH